MSNGLELYDSRIDRIALEAGVARIHFSHAYIHKTRGRPGRDPGTGWSQEAILTLFNATLSAGPPALPDAIAEGYLEVGGLRQEIIPLPFKRKVPARLWLRFAEGGELEIAGEKPFIELLGTPVFLEDLS